MISPRIWMLRSGVLADLADDWLERPVTERELDASAMRSDNGLTRLRWEQDRSWQDGGAGKMLHYHLGRARPRRIPLPPIPKIPRGIEFLKTNRSDP